MFSDECERLNRFVTFGYNSFVILHHYQWTGAVQKDAHSVGASLRTLADTCEFCQCDTTLYAIRFLRSDENFIFAAVMPSVRMFIAQDKRALWHVIATMRSSWFLILESAERSKKKIAECTWQQTLKQNTNKTRDWQATKSKRVLDIAAQHTR